ncbi:response regulator transcription factor [Serratia liquefaciens]|uniref:response regulator transcription factor n=1 Tax=Serratia liquefaciens TaxID=614 RepID=UPI003523C065
MTRVMKILIVDPNRFFVEGLQLAIRAHFQARGIPVVFMHRPLSYPMADLIFWAPGDPTTVMPAGLFARRTQISPVILLMSQDTPHLAANYIPSVFYRHQRCCHLSPLIVQTIESASGCPAEPAHEENSPHLAALSPRQREVMGYVSKGLRLSEISVRLHIHEKTVSNHKRAAMRKLQLSRTTDLHHWLLCNALMENPV